MGRLEVTNVSGVGGHRGVPGFLVIVEASGRVLPVACYPLSFEGIINLLSDIKGFSM